MPVYNEQDCILDVVRSWIDILDELKIRYEMLVINDGSRDNTRKILDDSRLPPRVHVIHKPNSGHGPTILQGYRSAAMRAEWVFQCDSDNEMKAGDFDRVWSKRAGYDAVFGCRTNRKQPLSRKIISSVSRRAVRLFFGKGVDDVNVPYRLMRSQAIRDAVERMPDDTATPNVILSGVLIQEKARVLNVDIPYENRKTGTVSIKNLRLWKFALRAFLQVIRWRFLSRPGRGIA